MKKGTKTPVKEINRLLICRSEHEEGTYDVWSPRRKDCLKKKLSFEEAVRFCEGTTDYVSMKVSETSSKYLLHAVGEDKLQKVLFLAGKHMLRYCLYDKETKKPSEICAWYQDWEDFCSDWCGHLGYTRTEARKLLNGKKGEFMVLPEGLGIIRFAL